MAESALASSASVTFERRCRAAFEEFQTSGVLLAANFDAAFRRAGFPDARAEEVERYHNNFLQQRRGVSGSHLKLDEFLRITADHHQKKRFIETIRISGQEWVSNAIRGVAHLFTKTTIGKDRSLWSFDSSESRMGIIMTGRAMLWGRSRKDGAWAGDVDFPICELGSNTVLGDSVMPGTARKVVALGQVDIIYIPMSEVKLRLGDKFLEQIALILDVKERHSQARMKTMQRICKRAKSENTLSQLPFLPLKNHLKEQLAQGMQKLAQSQIAERAAMQAAKRAKAQRTGDVGDHDDRPSSPPTEKSRKLRMERTGRLPTAADAKALALGASRPRTSMSRNASRSSIPRRIAASELHVQIDTGTMMYDDLM
jgi:hypothetical protein